MRNLIASCLVVAAYGCTPKQEPPAAPEPAQPAAEAPAPTPTPEPVAFDARQTFNTVCATCHGTEGLGDGPAGQALNPKPASFADASFWETRDRDHVVKVITEGGASVGKSALMIAYGSTYDAEQIGQLADIVMSYKPAE